MDDGALRRLMRQGRKAGGRDTEGTVRHPVTGTPKGGRGPLSGVGFESMMFLPAMQSGKTRIPLGVVH